MSKANEEITLEKLQNNMLSNLDNNYFKALGIPEEERSNIKYISQRINLFNDNLDSSPQAVKDKILKVNQLFSYSSNSNICDEYKLKAYAIAIKANLGHLNGKRFVEGLNNTFSKERYIKDISDRYLGQKVVIPANPTGIPSVQNDIKGELIKPRKFVDINNIIISFYQQKSLQSLKTALNNIDKESIRVIMPTESDGITEPKNKDLDENIGKALRLISYYEKKAKHDLGDQSILVYGNNLDEYDYTKTTLEKANIIDPDFNKKYAQAQKILSDKDVENEYREAYNKNQNNHEEAYTSAIKFKQNKEESTQLNMPSFKSPIDPSKLTFTTLPSVPENKSPPPAADFWAKVKIDAALVTGKVAARRTQSDMVPDAPKGAPVTPLSPLKPNGKGGRIGHS